MSYCLIGFLGYVRHHLISCEREGRALERDSSLRLAIAQSFRIGVNVCDIKQYYYYSSEQPVTIFSEHLSLSSGKYSGKLQTIDVIALLT